MSECDEEPTPAFVVSFDGETLIINGHSWSMPIIIKTEPVSFDFDSAECAAPYAPGSCSINGTLVTAVRAMCAVRAIRDWTAAKECR